MEEKEVIAYIFERKVINNDDESVSTYSYLPIDVVKGREQSIEDLKTLTFKSDKFKDISDDDDEMQVFPLNETYGIDEKYVYAFPRYTEGLTEEEKDKIIHVFKDEIPSLEDKLICQSYYKEDDKCKEFFIANDTNSMISVNTSEAKDLYEIIYRDYGYLSDIAHEVETKKERLTTPSVITFKPENIIYSNDIYIAVSKTVICQDEQIKRIATSIAKNSRLTDGNLKSNMLICGPTGVGKTEIFRCISRDCNIPIKLENSTEYTAASYKGKDVEEMLIHLIDAAGGDIERAQRGILVIDEIDKKVSHSSEHDTYTTAVITSLLKMMEGHVYNLNYRGEEIEFDTSNITFAFSGAFSGIEEFSKEKRSIGFDSSTQDKSNNKNYYNDETLVKYGLLPEFIGRNDTIVVMNNLDVPEFEQIIKKSDKSQLLLYKELFENMGIALTYDDETIKAIALKAKSLGLGARSIKKIIEEALRLANYDIFSSNKYKELIITSETIEDNKKYILK